MLVDVPFGEPFERLTEIFVDLLHRIDVLAHFDHHLHRFLQSEFLRRQSTIVLVSMPAGEDLLQKQGILQDALDRLDQIGLKR